MIYSNHHDNRIIFFIILSLILVFQNNNIYVKSQCSNTTTLISTDLSITSFNLLSSTNGKLVSEIDDGYIFCYNSQLKYNIEAIVTKTINETIIANNTNTNCNTTNTTIIDEPKKIVFRLYNSITNELLIRHVESIEPYTLYGNINNTLFGNILAKGKYKLLTSVLGVPDTLKIINFDIVYCSNYEPLNDCLTCSIQNKTCEGSHCVSTGYIRIVLLTYADDYWDYGMLITTPINTLIGAYNDYTISPYPLNDPITGGYVDYDYKQISCRSYGVWIKNIVFPTKKLIPSGIYNISIEDVAECFTDDDPFIRPFELKIYINEKLINLYTNQDGRDFSFEI